MPGPIVITGFMGCGKTEVARVLGQRLGLRVIDLDQVIGEREGRSPARIINENCERAFRTVETNTLRSVLEGMDACVISLGGGAWIEEENREVLNKASAETVWRDAHFELCWRRIEASGEGGPLGRTKPQALELFERRRLVYQTASVRITAGQDDGVEILASRIEKELVSLIPLCAPKL